MTKKSVPAAVDQTAFDCPHCGAFTTQTWYRVGAQALEKGCVPTIPTAERTEKVIREGKFAPEAQAGFREWTRKMEWRRIFVEHGSKDQGVYGPAAHNLYLSECFACHKFAVWVHARLVEPQSILGSQPNDDLPEDIANDFNEARLIAAVSPRGAAALLRLCVQKLCSHLGEKGKNIDDDIASLVKKGLAPLVQKSLDVVRVIGNEAVHPGTIDLRDDANAANSLFQLVNVIAEQMLTQPKQVQSLYDKLPQSKRDAIEKRDGK